jgi:hypothetical protein
LSLQDLARWTGMHEDMTCSDLHGGFGAQGWMQRPHVWGKLVIITCTVKKEVEVVSFGGTSNRPGWTAPTLSHMGVVPLEAWTSP